MPSANNMTKAFFAAARRYPVAVGFVVAGVVFYPLTYGVAAGEPGRLLLWMTITPAEAAGGGYRFLGLGATVARGEWWRLFSPMFVHFGLAHLAFNLLWVWVVGQRVEAASGRVALLTLVLLSSLGGNIAQYGMTGPGLYGGLSGVVYGLFGHAFVYGRLNPGRDLGFPIGLYVFVFGFLLLGVAGVIDWLLQISVANGAHLGGLAVGLVFGGVAGGVARWRKRDAA